MSKKKEEQEGNCSAVVSYKHFRWYLGRHTFPTDKALRNHFVQLLEMAFLRNAPVGPLLYLLLLEMK
jgi:hypothetical protein